VQLPGGDPAGTLSFTARRRQTTPLLSLPPIVEPPSVSPALELS